jgi:hypothetical protein
VEQFEKALSTLLAGIEQQLGRAHRRSF